MLTSPLFKAVRSLNFGTDRRAEIQDIAPSEWPRLLTLTDRSHITLPLGIRCQEYLPQSIAARIERNLADNSVRQERLFSEYRAIAEVLRAREIDFVVLKGMAHGAPFYVGDLRHRPQYDIDIYCPPVFLESARQGMTAAGFLPVRSFDKRTDHLPAMMRNQNWRWRDDYYDPDLPLTVEIHFRFWDHRTERLPASGVDAFWSRRTTCLVRGTPVPTLSLSDGVSYAAMHLVRHLLRGDLRIYHVYELAHFLHSTEADHELWGQWLENRAGKPPIIDSVAFRLAIEWFGCSAHSIPAAAARNLPRNVAKWFELFCWSPLPSERHNKDEVFLHLSLAEKHSDRCRIVARRLLPLKPPALINAIDAGAIPSRLHSVKALMRQLRFVTGRAVHHLKATLPLIQSLCRWVLFSGRYVARSS